MSSSDLSQSIGNASAALGVGNVTFESEAQLLNVPAPIFVSDDGKLTLSRAVYPLNT